MSGGLGNLVPPETEEGLRVARQRDVPTAKYLALTLVKRWAWALDRLATHTTGVVILIYHRIGDARNEITIPLSLFQRQMAWLAASGRVVSLEDALEDLDRPEPMADTRLVLTFDDGTADFAEMAVPTLVRERIPATLYLSTMFAETQRPFPDGAPPASWGSLSDAMSTGLLTIGSHTHSHAILDRLPLDAARDELDRSIGLIEDRLDRSPLDLAYPKAFARSAEVRELVQRRFRSAAVGGGRANVPGGSDPYRLQRTFVQRSDGWRWFEEKTLGHLTFEDVARRGWDRWRYRSSVS
jgi:peptidoglycan/xylan/chitin deacetylase (PgdA/CDA1 family)